MRNKTYKLIKAVAKTNPYNVSDFSEDTKYLRHKMNDNIMLSPSSERLTIKLLKKHYKRGDLTTQDLRAALNS